MSYTFENSDRILQYTECYVYKNLHADVLIIFSSNAHLGKNATTVIERSLISIQMASDTFVPRANSAILLCTAWSVEINSNTVLR